MALGPLPPCAPASGARFRRLYGVLLRVSRLLHSCTCRKCVLYYQKNLRSRLPFSWFLSLQESEPTFCADECLLDLRSGTTDIDETVRSSDYGPELWRTSFESLVSSHDTSMPLFVYYAESLVHEPLEVSLT